MSADDARRNLVSLRELKRRYKLNLALGSALPPYDQSISLPLSTGNPLFDAALTDKLTVTTTMSEAEHLHRGWNLVKGATPDEMQVLAGASQGLLNDYKLLLALKAWQDGDTALTRTFLRSLPWHWRLAFPIAVIKPSAHIFTGWKRSLRFRLVDAPRFDALKELYREVLAQAPSITLLKYRRVVQEATALLHYRFTGERERAIHDWCYDAGNVAALEKSVEPIGVYVRARQALRTGGASALLDVLNTEEQVIPITSYMGMLGSAKISLTEKGQQGLEGLRDYAIRSATAVESLLRLVEWSPWLTEKRVARLAEKVRGGILETGLDIPFFKVLKGFNAAPTKVRKMVLQPLLLPLLRHFGQQNAALLPPPGPITFLQPANLIHVMSFLLYATLTSAAPTRLLLLKKKGIEEVDPIPLEEVGEHLADSEQELQRYLLSEFGNLTQSWDYTYDFAAIQETLVGLDPAAPLVLDLPYASDLDTLEALLPFERVFNLGSAYGAPGELCIAYEYYTEFFIGTRKWNHSVWSRYSDSAALKFAEVMDRLQIFQQLAGHVESRDGATV